MNFPIFLLAFVVICNANIRNKRQYEVEPPAPVDPVPPPAPVPVPVEPPSPPAQECPPAPKPEITPGCELISSDDQFGCVEYGLECTKKPIERKPAPTPVNGKPSKGKRKCEDRNPAEHSQVHPENNPKCRFGQPGWEGDEACRCEYIVKDRDGNGCALTYWNKCYIEGEAPAPKKEPAPVEAPAKVPAPETAPAPAPVEHVPAATPAPGPSYRH